MNKHVEELDGCDHGRTGKECRPDPSPNGKDCLPHGNHGGVNEDHCLPTPPPTSPPTTVTTTPDPTTTTTTTTTITSTPPGLPTTSTTLTDEPGTTTTTVITVTPSSSAPLAPQNFTELAATGRGMTLLWCALICIAVGALCLRFGKR